MNKNILAVIVGALAVLAGVAAAFFLIQKKLAAENEDFDDFEDFDMMGDDDFFGDDEYTEYDGMHIGASDSIPFEGEEEAAEEVEEAADEDSAL